MSRVRIEPLGDSALLIRFGERIDNELNARVHATAQVLRDASLLEVRDIVPAYASIAVHFDSAIRLDRDSDGSPVAPLMERLHTLVEKSTFVSAPNELPQIEIPVCYGGEYGLDLVDVAQHAGLDTAEVIALHASAGYRVAMLGFAPGFPYLFGLDPRLHMPRRAQPRTRVPAGSVAIGGAQTGIYPRELPGGWQIIGRTPLNLFDATRAAPALLAPGQRVRFHAIDVDTFARLSR